MAFDCDVDRLVQNSSPLPLWVHGSLVLLNCVSASGNLERKYETLNDVGVNRAKFLPPKLPASCRTPTAANVARPSSPASASSSSGTSWSATTGCNPSVGSRPLRRCCDRRAIQRSRTQTRWRQWRLDSDMCAPRTRSVQRLWTKLLHYESNCETIEKLSERDASPPAS